MALDAFSLPVVFLFIATSVVNLVSRDWRVMIIALGIQYLGVFILVSLTWPLEMAVIKLVTGLIASAVLGMELINRQTVDSIVLEVHGEGHFFSNTLFRIFFAIVIGFAIYSFTPQMAKWILNASYYQILGSLLLIGMGILILGITNKPFRIIVGLLTFLSGFEILFATLETSVIIAGFFSFTAFGISLLGAYFIASPDLRKDA